MVMLPKPLILFSLLIFATACGPLVPLSYVNGSADSQLTQSIETSEGTVWLRYMESQDGYMVFDLEIVNHSQHEMPLAPQLISFYASSKTFVLLQTGDDAHRISAPNSTLTMTRQFACDPFSIEKFYLRKAKSKKVEAGIFAILTIGLILFDAAQDSQDAQKESTSTRTEINSIGRDVIVSAALVATDIAKSSAAQTAEESNYLPYELFPECTIKPGSNVRGKIFLPLESSHKYVRVVVPLTDADYVFDFRRRGAKTNQSQ